MATYRSHTRVPAAPDAVWALLADPANIPKWMPGVEHAVFDGTHRVLTLLDGGTLRARVVTDDAVLRRVQYSFVDGMPQPITFHLGTIDILEDPEGSLVIYSHEIEPAELGAIVGPAAERGTDGIRRYFES